MAVRPLFKLDHPLRIEVVATGNELLDGTITDTNSKMLAEALAPFGLKIARAVVVPDDRQSLRLALQEATSKADLVIVSGGLGPTSDDLTLEVAAEAFGSVLVENADAKANVVERLRRLKRVKINASNMKQALIPQGSKVLRNLEGTAPGIHWEYNGRTLFFLPGVPREYQYLLQKYLLPWFETHSAKEGEFLFIRKVFGWPESELNELMKKIKVPRQMELGYRTHFPENHLKIRVRAANEKEARRLAHPLLSKIETKLGEAYFADESKSFAQAFVETLLAQNQSLAIAESCTGGLAASMITQISGSSKVLDRGFVVYSNEAKVDLLGVKKETLKKFGAVSKETVEEMALGALKNSLATKSVAITGIAGPTGGTPEKPVGTIWIAVAKRNKSKVVKLKSKLLQLSFDRERNQKYSAYFALQFAKHF